MKILIATGIFPPDIGGPATYSKILADELPKLGIGVEVLSYSSTGRGLPKIFRYVTYFLKVLKEGWNVDLLYAQDPVFGLAACVASFILRKPFLLKVVGDYAWEQGVNRFGVKELLDEFLDKKYGWRVEFLRWVEKWVASQAYVVIVPSHYLKSVVEKWNVNPEKIKVIYNSVQLRYIEVEKERARKELGLSGKILVSIGRSVPWKGFEMLNGLMPEIKKKYPDAKLFIISSRPHEEVLKYLKAADIFLLNTGYEGFSHQILEAMAVGAPTISTHAGGNKEILVNRQNALVAGYNDKEGWMEAIFELLDNPALAQNLADNAKKDIQKFTGQNMIEETLKVLKEI